MVFFVIGGFIVSLTLIKERERGSLDPLRFYLRRIVRIGVQARASLPSRRRHPSLRLH